MSEGSHEAARPATVEDLKRLLAALSAEQVDYVLIGGYALHALGYQRATVDIEGLLKTKRTARDKDRVDRAVLEQALQAIRRGTPP